MFYTETVWTRTQDWCCLRVVAPVVVGAVAALGIVALRHGYDLAVAVARWGDLFGVLLVSITGLGLLACGIIFGFALLKSALAETRDARRVRR